MTRYLLFAGDVHAVAAGCDYLEGRLGADDAVTALAVDGPGRDGRDGGDALNVAAARLGSRVPVATETRTGAPAARLLEVAREAGADEVVVPVRPAAADAAASPVEDLVVDLVEHLVAAATWPVVVVPVPRAPGGRGTVGDG